MMMLSLNLHHGDDYGRAFFSMKARTLLQDALKEALDLEKEDRPSRREPYGPESFRELERLLRDLSRSSDEYRQSDHLLHVLQSLLDLPQLNLTPGPQGDHPAANHAIHMPEVVREKQVVYFWLQSLMDVTTVAEIARLVLYSALTAAVSYRDETGRKPRVYLIADEAQILVAQNIANVLAQAREYQVGCVLAHQTLSQLNPPGGVDLRELVLSCTSIKQFWSARDPNLKDYISKISGEVGYYSASWDQFKHRVQGGEVGRQYAASHPNEPMYIRVSEQVGPRLTSQDIEDYSRQPNTSILAIERNAGFSCFQGAFPVHMDWIMSEDEHRRRNLELGWPEGSEETIQTKGVWPKVAPSETASSGGPALDENESESLGQSARAGSKLDEFARQFQQQRRRP